MSANLRFLEFITKPGCHLCDDALPIVTEEAASRGWRIVERSVLDDDDLMAQTRALCERVLPGAVALDAEVAFETAEG